MNFNRRHGKELQTMRNKIISGTLGALCFLIAINAHARKTVDQIVAIVNEDVITLYDLDRAMAPSLDKLKNAHNREFAYAELKQSTLEDLVDETLLKQEIKKAKIEVSDEELAGFIHNILTNNQITLDQLKSEVHSKGKTFEEYKQEITDEIERIRFIQRNFSSNIEVSDEEVAAFIKKENGASLKITVTLETWTLPLDFDLSQREIRKTISKHQKWTDNVRRGKDIKSKKVKKETWGPLSIHDLPSAVGQIVRTLQPGAVSDPIVDVGALYIVKLLDKKEKKEEAKKMSQEKAREILFNDKLQDTMAQFLQKLRRNAFIDIRK